MYNKHAHTYVCIKRREIDDDSIVYNNYYDDDDDNNNNDITTAVAGAGKNLFTSTPPPSAAVRACEGIYTGFIAVKRRRVKIIVFSGRGGGVNEACVRRVLRDGRECCWRGAEGGKGRPGGVDSCTVRSALFIHAPHERTDIGRLPRATLFKYFVNN